MSFTNFVRGIVKRHPELRFKLKKALSKQTAFQYVTQTIFMTIMSTVTLLILALITLKSNLLLLMIVACAIILLSPMIYLFFFSYVDVLVRRKGREIDRDLLFVSEYFLVSLESGLPLGNSIKNLSKLNRPGGEFFKKVYDEFRTGKDLEGALYDAISYSPSESMKILLKRLKDSLNIGVDLKEILVNFINESSDKKVLEIKEYSKKLNPIVMMYLIIGIILPSLGVTFFILAASVLSITPSFLKLILVLIFLVMFGLQYFSYSAFKFSKATL